MPAIRTGSFCGKAGRASISARCSKKNEPDGGSNGEDQNENLEKLLRDDREHAPPDQNAQRDERHQDDIQCERRTVDQAEMRAEGDFDHVDDQKKQRARPDELDFWQVDREQVERHDRAGGIGHHRRNS